VQPHHPPAHGHQVAAPRLAVDFRRSTRARNFAAGSLQPARACGSTNSSLDFCNLLSRGGIKPRALWHEDGSCRLCSGNATLEGLFHRTGDRFSSWSVFQPRDHRWDKARLRHAQIGKNSEIARRKAVTYEGEPRARLNGARSGSTRVDSGMRHTCYNSPGAVIIHDACLPTVDSPAWTELSSYLLRSMRVTNSR